MKAILDLDTGIDDALALAYAIAHPDLDLIGVICTYGNVTVPLAVAQYTGPSRTTGPRRYSGLCRT